MCDQKSASIWEQIEERAKVCPHMRLVVALVDVGHSREDVLGTVALALSRTVQELTELEVKRRQLEIPVPIVISRGTT